MNSEGSVSAQESWILREYKSEIALTLPKKPRTFFFFEQIILGRMEGY